MNLQNKKKLLLLLLLLQDGKADGLNLQFSRDEHLPTEDHSDGHPEDHFEEEDLEVRYVEPDGKGEFMKLFDVDKRGILKTMFSKEIEGISPLLSREEYVRASPTIDYLTIEPTKTEYKSLLSSAYSEDDLQNASELREYFDILDDDLKEIVSKEIKKSLKRLEKK